ncbi:decarboxylating NADP(+)-dependent phosphogluconate dehydrogenase [Thiomicrorhabdus sp. 6S3-12]|uniref:decarboxylating NADP(+)-dependent phosphogluconate dehydrogenase n=1 Tax=Thiomicrorhabdus sp. 6S3-12 TaxID=2819681 RepID=UPI001AAE0C53|nr:decarboxylating NADP(+)-dependent phosphogluconate dehydrogenase [Thiomicrorhabdus sp. 6S3-12]MBO1924869.1 decarboxylating NADP(+)-dependent phosphogluconate dehydrogenase [Thiomicrorhabdus sp. 6S3-12]
MAQQADIALIGLAVMGQNLVLNMTDHGFKVAVYNRSRQKTDEFLAAEPDNANLIGCFSIEELVNSLSAPRKIMLMVKAGEVVDLFIEQLLPYLEAGDIVIDGGNSLYTDSQRRTEALAEKGIQFIGTGVSGGEEGARHGPSIMPGGNPSAWPSVKPIFQAISAKADGAPCCDWVGDGGAGHYVKMVHNGIEYGDMQLIAECYHLMRYGLGLSADECQQVFAEWNQGVLDSYLIEITAEILKFKDQDGEPLVDKILDAAGQKGTGKWTGISSLELGIPVTLITESVYARCLSALKEERIKAEANFGASAEPPSLSDAEKSEMLQAIHDALYASKIVSYAQGYMLMRESAKEFGWELNYGGIALMWRGGCIIRSTFLGEIKKAYENDPELSNLLLADFFSSALKNSADNWRKAVIFAIQQQIPTPTLSSALAFFDGYKTAKLPANLLQAQRDYFGAHTYERVDAARGEFFHTDWIQSGGRISSTTYEV